MSEEKNSDFKIKSNTATISFEEAMGITPIVTIDLSSDVAAARADVEISEQFEYNQENGTSFSWDYVPDKDLIKIENFETETFEIELNEPKTGVSSGIIWKFAVLDLLDELCQIEEPREKTAPSSLVNFFENRDPRLGTLAQKESD